MGKFKGRFKKESDTPGYLTKGLNLFGKRLKENVQTKLDVEQKTSELMKALKLYKNDILERMMREQGFNNEESANDKNTEMLNKLMEKQNQQLSTFFDKVDQRLSVMSSEIINVKGQVQTLTYN